VAGKNFEKANVVEFNYLKAPVVQSRSQVLDIKDVSKDIANCDILERLKFSRNLPWAFTEHGTVMAASVLNSPEAVSMNVSGKRTCRILGRRNPQDNYKAIF